MTTETTLVESASQPEQHPASTGRADAAVRIAGYIASEGVSPGHRAELRRMDPDAPDTAIFWRLMAGYDLLGNPTLEKKWALIIHGIALMTPRGAGDGNRRSAHNGYVPVGQALFLGSESRREKGYYSESRLNRLLTSRGPILRTLLARMFRMLASADVTFNWREMARFILNEGYNEEATNNSRRRIARDYFRAEFSSSQSDED